MNKAILLQGRYDHSDTVDIDCNNAYEEMTVYIHELAHLQLEKNTMFGILTFLIKQISEESGMFRLVPYLKVLHDASERTQECYAMCSELIFVESQIPQLLEFYKQTIRGSVYYRKYQFAKLEFLFDLPVEVIARSRLIDSLFAMAMNISLPPVMEYKHWKTEGDLVDFISSDIDNYCPDARLDRIIIALKELLLDKKVEDIKEEDFFSRTGIAVDSWNNINMIIFLKQLISQFRQNQFSTVLLERNLERQTGDGPKLGYGLEKDDGFEKMIHQAILPNCLVHTYTNEPIEGTLDSLKDKNIHVITIYDYDDITVLELTDTMHGKKYSAILPRRMVQDSKYISDPTIVFYFDDIRSAKSYWKRYIKKRYFIQLKNTYTEFKELIQPYITEKPAAFLYRLNHGVCFLFVQGNDDDVYFTCQSMINVDYIREDFTIGFYTGAKFSDLDIIDGVFCKQENDWKNFSNIVLYATEAKYGEVTKDEFTRNIMLY